MSKNVVFGGCRTCLGKRGIEMYFYNKKAPDLGAFSTKMAEEEGFEPS